MPCASDYQAYNYRGIAAREKGAEQAERYFRLVAQGDSTPQSALYYNDLPSDVIPYQELARCALNEEAAKKCFLSVDFL